MQRLRWIGYLEGTSFLVLLLIAMPLKRWAEMPKAVTLVGGLHGALWVLYVLALVHAMYVLKWPLKTLLAGLVASVLPLGPFVFEAALRRRQAG